MASRLRQSADAFAPAGHMVPSRVERLTTERWFLSTMALNDAMQHVSEAAHVLRLIAPEMRWG